MRPLLLRFTCVLLVATTCACTAAPPEATPIGTPSPRHISYSTGYTRLSSGWSGARDQWAFGVLDADWRPPGWPVWIAGQMLLTYSSDTPDIAPGYADFSGAYEFSLGVRRYTAVGRAEPWVGAGVALLGGSVCVQFQSGGWYWSDQLDDDVAWGWYADAGVQVPLTPLFTLGLVVRWSDGADLDLFDEDVQPGGFSVLALIGSRL